jgi:hypothetical protein
MGEWMTRCHTGKEWKYRMATKPQVCSGLRVVTRGIWDS